MKRIIAIMTLFIVLLFAVPSNAVTNQVTTNTGTSLERLV